MTLSITKASGEQELFDLGKFKGSLGKAGASHALIEEIAQRLQEQLSSLTSSKQIYGFALNYLQDKNPVVASRYNLKQALLQLGPTGFPFEKFVAEIFAKQGYEVKTDQILSGSCVEHEVDVVALQQKKHAIVECKFHQRAGLKVDVTVALYVKARFDDIKASWQHESPVHLEHTIWLATNAKFTSEAIRYAQCVDIQLLGWSYPADTNLQTLIDRFGLHPITALVTLNNHQKHRLIQAGFVFCRDAPVHKRLLDELGLTAQQVRKFVNECQEICRLGAV